MYAPPTNYAFVRLFGHERGPVSRPMERVQRVECRESRGFLVANPPCGSNQPSDRPAGPTKSNGGVGDFGLMYRKSQPPARPRSVSPAEETSCPAGRRRGERPDKRAPSRPLPPLRAPAPSLPAGVTRGGCERHSTVTKGNHHRSGGTGTSSGHKLSKSRRYFAGRVSRNEAPLAGAGR